MKRTLLAILVFSAAGAAGLAAESLLSSATPTGQSKPPRYEVGERGAHHRVWRKVTEEMDAKGVSVSVTNDAYVEMATGLHYQQNGQWRETKEEFTLVPGWAVARNGPHKVSLAYNLNTAGPVATELPDGRVMRSQVLSLHYLDRVTGQSVRLAEIKDCVGVVLPPNQVIYTNAFDGLNADVRLTYTRAGIEQDIILRAQPPSPSKLGLNPDTTRLAVLTEFLNPPTPVLKREEVYSATGYTDTEMDDAEVDFGPMHIGRGKAFLIGTGSESSPERKRTPVFKRWMEMNGRHFLMESVPMEVIKDEVGKLPEQAGLSPRDAEKLMARVKQVAPSGSVGTPAGGFFDSAAGRGAGAPRFTDAQVEATLDIPEASRAEPTLQNLEVAQVMMKESPGYVIDYVQLNTSLTNYTFAGNMTYYISGLVNMYGTNTFEGGAVIKFSGGGMLVAQGGAIICNSSPYRPTIFTSENDNTVGEVISGSTGVPSIDHLNGYYLTLNGVSSVNLHHLRFAYAYTALTVVGGTGVVSDVQFVHADYPAYFNNSTLNVRNVLMNDVQQVAFSLESSSVSVEHLTVNECVYFGLNESASTMTMTNSLLVGVTSLGDIPLTMDSVGDAAANSGVFQTVGAGAHYLAANSAYRNVGTTNINAALLARLRTQTTYPPLVYSNVTLTADLILQPQAQRDTDTPDLRADSSVWRKWKRGGLG